MKKSRIILIILCAVFALFFMAVSILLFLIPSIRENRYYANEENYIEATGVINHINRSGSTLYLGIANIEPAGFFSDSSFQISGMNYKMVERTGLFDDLQIGDTVTFISAPGIFGDGFSMHIVSISKEGKTYLTFEAGIRQFQED